MPIDNSIRLRNSFARIARDMLQTPGTAGVAPDAGAPSTLFDADRRAALAIWRTHAADLLRDAPKRPCPACAATAHHALFDSYDGHRFVECAECRCWYTPIAAGPAVFESLRQRSAEGRALAGRLTSVDAQALNRDADLLRFSRYLDVLLPLLPPSTRRRSFLDAACGVGHALRAARARGLNVCGIEADAAARAAAQDSGLAVSEPADVMTGSFHLIGWWDGLAHATDPLATLRRLQAHLDADGLLAVTVPNLNALEIRVGRELSPRVYGGYYAPGHLQLMHEGALRTLFARADLTLLDVEGESTADAVGLVEVITGRSRGVYDSLDAPAAARPPGPLAATTGAAWPGAALLEAITLTSPFIHAIACKAGRETAFAAAIDERRGARVNRWRAQADELIAGEPDYESMVRRFEGELERQAAETAALRSEMDRLREQAQNAGTLIGQLRRGRQLAGRAARRLGLRR